MKNKGFTLIELMIVVAIIAIIAAIAIPNLLRSRLQSNEAAAIGNLRTVVASQTAFAAAERGYANDLALLMTPAEGPAYLDIDLTAPVVQGYVYTLTEGDGAELEGNTVASVYTNFFCNADPATEGSTGIRFFGVDASGVVRWAAAALASADDGEPI